MKSSERPNTMSQLDWLWENYSGYNVSDETTGHASSALILTEHAVAEMIQDVSGGGITSLELKTVEQSDGTEETELVGYGIDGSELTIVKLPLDEHIASFTAGRNEEDNPILVIATNKGGIYEVEVPYVEAKVSLSDRDGNIITKESSGALYAAVEWNEEY